MLLISRVRLRIDNRGTCVLVQTDDGSWHEAIVIEPRMIFAGMPTIDRTVEPQEILKSPIVGGWT